MLALVLEALRATLPPFEVTEHAVNCHHNYVARERHFGAEVWVTRKGAIRAGAGELGVIPGSILVFLPVAGEIESSTYLLYDGACGTGGMLTVAEVNRPGKVEVRVLPDEVFGLIHGKAGVITRGDGARTSFLGSANESAAAFRLNYPVEDLRSARRPRLRLTRGARVARQPLAERRGVHRPAARQRTTSIPSRSDTARRSAGWTGNRAPASSPTTPDAGA